MPKMPKMPKWVWVNTYRYHFEWDEHPFTSYFDVHQGYKVLTHCQMIIQVDFNLSLDFTTDSSATATAEVLEDGAWHGPPHDKGCA